MNYTKRITTSGLILLSLLLPAWLCDASSPTTCRVDGVPRVKQITNYCGPAALTTVFNSLGLDTTQQDVGKVVFDKQNGATSGADMLLYAREKGFAAYSWNSSIDDVKKKLALGLPVIVLQQNSTTDTSGHYRVLTGYDDAAKKFYVTDPYYDDITELTYAACSRLWNTYGQWALVIMPKEKDTFKNELDAKNPVLHMDLSYAKFKRGEYEDALKETKLALRLEPDNMWATSMLGKIQRAVGAGAK